MDTRGIQLRQVALMQYACDEEEKMSKLNVLWALSMDLKHDNMLVYPLDIMVEDVNDVCQRKYVDGDNFYEYHAENGSHWLVSESIEVQDLDAFFQIYFHTDEVAA